MPDLVRGAAAGTETVVRNPGSTRPWQHVLEPLAGYLLLGQRLHGGETALARAWNFGPAVEGVLTVEEVVRVVARTWPAVRHRVERPAHAPHEAGLLTLDCSLARSLLGWRPIWDGAPAFEHTARWYQRYIERGEVCSAPQLADYVREAQRLGAVWAEAGQ